VLSVYLFWSIFTLSSINQHPLRKSQ
jgi:hypothetical protein